MNFYTQAVFLKSAARVDQLPSDEGYEVAFAGRSNAGKSSALNTLTQSHLARTSKTPGRTQLMNVFTVKDDMHRLIDLPGYGYAKVARETKEAWQRHLSHYLNVRQSLKGLILLMDIRHPMKDLDQMMLHWALERDLCVHVLLTKADKLSRGAAQQALLQLKNSLLFQHEGLSIQLFSSLKKQGIESLILKLNDWFEWGAD